MKQKVVVLTGAGISAESGLKTFRDADGLWEGYNVYDVATPEAWERNPEMVQEFYNLRRKAVLEAFPNEAHYSLARLENKYDVSIITQNVDDLHQRAGSSRVYHLHGEITKSQSTKKPSLIYPIEGWQLNMSDVCELGSPLRPHVVWFGEAVPMMNIAMELCSMAEVFIVIGTSLQVYPAASLIDFVPDNAEKFLVDPAIPEAKVSGFTLIKEKAGTGVSKVVEQLLA